ncbi:MAG: hypothetical protein SPJ08_03780, partial [Sphaerochaetaceae bacterium]|nr:hypothetical protein [Sphaerochaetaceae bacterium]
KSPPHLVLIMLCRVIHNNLCNLFKMPSALCTFKAFSHLNTLFDLFFTQNALPTLYFQGFQPFYPSSS